MDLVLHNTDYYILTPYVYPTWWNENDVTRQLISLFVIVNAFGYILYLTTASLSYYFMFDHRLMKHPHFLKDQVKLEIEYTCKSVPLIAVPTVLLFLLEVRGHSKLYDNVDSKLGYAGVMVSAFTFIVFTDACIYWIHRFLHHKHVYKHVHKPHHKWIISTPFASHAFHPLDGFLQSCPYHIYAFLFPLHKVLYLCLFVFVNVWTVSIHDGNYMVPDILKPYINGSAHHTDHHLFYNYNYGQYFTLWDRIGGSFKQPSVFGGNGHDILVQHLDNDLHVNEHDEMRRNSKKDN